MLCSHGEKEESVAELHQLKERLQSLIRKVAKLRLLHLHIGTTVDTMELRQDISGVRRMLCEELAQSKEQVMGLWNGSLSATDVQKGTCERLTYVYISLIEYFIQDMQRTWRLYVDLLRVATPAGSQPDGSRLTTSGNVHPPVDTTEQVFHNQLPHLRVNCGVVEATNVNKSSMSFALPRSFRAASRKNSTSSRASLDAEQEITEEPDLLQQMAAMQLLLNEIDSCIHLCPWNMEGSTVMLKQSHASLVSADEDEILLAEGNDPDGSGVKREDAALTRSEAPKEDGWVSRSASLSGLQLPGTNKSTSSPAAYAPTNIDKSGDLPPASKAQLNKHDSEDKLKTNLVLNQNGDKDIEAGHGTSPTTHNSLTGGDGGGLKSQYSATVSHNKRRKKCIIFLIVSMLIVAGIVIAVVVTQVKR